MRVLSLFTVVLAACYDPGITDCQFTCPDNQCPGDLACVAGLCRTAGAAGSCPCADPPAGCQLAVNSAGMCLAACNTMRAWAAAQTACAASPPWHLAVLDTPGTLSAGEGSLRSTTWIGLTRGSPTTDWFWIKGGGSVSPASPDWNPVHSHLLSTCAELGDSKLDSDACDAGHPYACTSNY